MQRSTKGRGAQHNPNNRFEPYIRDEFLHQQSEEKLRTTLIQTQVKSMINKVDSPDVPFSYSMNPYQGCEHGCVYCYARNTHNYWGYSAGLDFETKIIYKSNAAKVFTHEISKKSWNGDTIMLSGNTDCYQPAEKDLQLTRSLLEIALEFGNPISIITKNALIKRDLDILEKMNEKGLIQVAISITGIQDDLRKKMEPRATSIEKRFETVEVLSQAGIPVFVMVGPVIPGLNDTDIIPILEKSATLGARDASYIMCRLNGDVADIFDTWLQHFYPDRRNKVINFIKEVHGGQTNDSRFGTRMKGEGKWAEIIKSQYKLAKKKYFTGDGMPALNHEYFHQLRNPQYKLF